MTRFSCYCPMLTTTCSVESSSPQQTSSKSHHQFIQTLADEAFTNTDSYQLAT
jgi:hypothetical protein